MSAPLTACVPVYVHVTLFVSVSMTVAVCMSLYPAVFATILYYVLDPVCPCTFRSVLFLDILSVRLSLSTPSRNIVYAMIGFLA